MSQKISHEQKELAIEAIKAEGTMKAAAKAAGVTVVTLNHEMRRSSIFKKRVLEARSEGYSKLADEARQLVIDYMSGKYDKTDRNRLTAAIALLNAYEPGFRGTSKIEGRIEHDIKVITGVPRPRYEEIDTPPKKMLKSGKRTKKIDIRDEQGNYIGTQTVEAIDGEVINE